MYQSFLQEEIIGYTERLLHKDSGGTASYNTAQRELAYLTKFTSVAKGYQQLM